MLIIAKSVNEVYLTSNEFNDELKNSERVLMKLGCVPIEEVRRGKLKVGDELRRGQS